MQKHSRTAAGAGLILSLALVVGVPSYWALNRSTDTGVGALPVATTTPAIPTTTAPATPQATVEPAPAPVKATSEPTKLSVPQLSLAAPIDPVGVDAKGAVVIPKDARRVGWYRFGSAPGDAVGSAVLVGHRDSRTQGQGVLYPLAKLSVGDRLSVARADGSTVSYRVVERRLYLKATLPVQTFFGRTGPARLTVITCGGPYDPDRGGYQDNLVVTAVPI